MKLSLILPYGYDTSTKVSFINKLAAIITRQYKQTCIQETF